MLLAICHEKWWVINVILMYSVPRKQLCYNVCYNVKIFVVDVISLVTIHRACLWMALFVLCLGVVWRNGRQACDVLGFRFRNGVFPSWFEPITSASGLHRGSQSRTTLMLLLMQALNLVLVSCRKVLAFGSKSTFNNVSCHILLRFSVG
jgi:hypothetical protein